MEIEQRKQILINELSKYSRHGYQILAQTDNTAQLKKHNKFSGVGLFVFGLIPITKRPIEKDKYVFIRVDEDGKVIVT